LNSLLLLLESYHERLEQILHVLHRVLDDGVVDEAIGTWDAVDAEQLLRTLLSQHLHVRKKKRRKQGEKENENIYLSNIEM
jgi:hypothetical protein